MFRIVSLWLVYCLGLSGHAIAQDSLLAANKSMALTEQCLQTLVGVATFETFGEMEGLDEPGVLTEGTVKVFYDRGKYHLRIKMKKQLTEFRTVDRDGKVLEEGIADSKNDEVFIIFDGETVYTIAFSERMNPTGCSGEIHDSLRDTIRMNGIGADDPAHLWRNAGEVDYLIEKSAKKELVLDAERVKPDGSITIGYPIPNSRSRVEQDLDPNLGFRTSEMRIFNLGTTGAVNQRQVFWESIDGELYATRRINTEVRDGSEMRVTFRYEKFEANVDVDSKLFTLDSVDIPHGTRFINRRRNNGERFLWKGDDGLSPDRQTLSKYLAFDKGTERIELATKGRYQKYALIDDLPAYLEARRERVIAEVGSLCSLTQEQVEKLQRAMRLHDSKILRDAIELASRIDSKPRIPNEEIRDFFAARESLDRQFKQDYFASQGIVYKVLLTQLDDEKLQLFPERKTSGFVELITQRLKLDKNQIESMQAFVEKHVGELTQPVFDHQSLFDAMLKSELTNLMDDKRINQLNQATKYLDSVNDFFRGMPDSTSE